MVTRDWTTGRGSAHAIRVEHWHLFSGRARVLLDGHEVWGRSSKWYDTGFECRFEVDGVACLVRALYRTWYYEYELWADGKLQ